MDYILKDDIVIMKEQIRKSLTEIQERLKVNTDSKKESFTVESASHVLYISVDDIYYFETTPKKHAVALMTNEEYVEFYDTLGNISQLFPNRFLRIHQSYLVNKRYQKPLDKRHKQVILLDGNKCLITYCSIII